MLYQQLSQKLPLIYSGCSAYGLGHAFVCDGYDGNGYFHFNWGWSGSYDGYFALHYLVPDGVGTYSCSQSAILNLHPQDSQLYEDIDFVSGHIAGKDTRIPLLGLKYSPIFKQVHNYEAGVFIKAKGSSDEPIFISLGISNGNEDNIYDLDIKSLNLDTTKDYILRMMWRGINEAKWKNTVIDYRGLTFGSLGGSEGGYLTYDIVHNVWVFSFSAGVDNTSDLKINSVTFNNDGNVYTNLPNYVDLDVVNNSGEHIVEVVRYEFIDENNKRYAPTRSNLELSPYEIGEKHIKTINFKNIPLGKYRMEIMTNKEHVLWSDPTRYFTVMEGVPVESIEKVGRGVLTGKIGDQIQLEAKVYPENTTFKDIEWWSETEDIATVDSNGLVTLKGPGRAIIRATPSYNTDWRIGWWIDVEEPSIPATSITLDKTDIVLHKGETTTLTATINPSDATETDITWHISDTSVAMIDNGTITAMSAGECEVTATTSNGLTATCHVRVIQLPSVITLDSSNLELHRGGDSDSDSRCQPGGCSRQYSVVEFFRHLGSSCGRRRKGDGNGLWRSHNHCNHCQRTDCIV